MDERQRRLELLQLAERIWPGPSRPQNIMKLAEILETFTLTGKCPTSEDEQKLKEVS